MRGKLQKGNLNIPNNHHHQFLISKYYDFNKSN